MKEIKVIKKSAIVKLNQPPNPAESLETGKKRWTEIETVESWVKIWRERKNIEISRAVDQLNAATISRRNIFSR